MPRVAVIGAGMAGLLATHELRRVGHEVTVLDKGHRPGGRLATRRIGGAVFDTGAQFFTVRDGRFAAHVDGWSAAGTADVWFHGAPDPGPGPDGGHPRFRGAPSMRSIAEHLAVDLGVRLARRVTEVTSGPDGWRVVSVGRQDPADRDEVVADALLCTAPVPQTLEMLAGGGVALSPDLHRELAAVTYAPTVAVLAVPTGTPRLGERGAVRLDEGPVAFISDNHAKGTSPVPAVTLHASEELSRRRWTGADEAIAAEVLAAAHAWVGEAEVVATHRWRYATPTGAVPDDVPPARIDHAPLPIAFAGDAFSGGRLEGAALSGLAAADLLTDALA
jgi:renalase